MKIHRRIKEEDKTHNFEIILTKDPVWSLKNFYTFMSQLQYYNSVII
jgi:hypothetical protein